MKSTPKVAALMAEVLATADISIGNLPGELGLLDDLECSFRDFDLEDLDFVQHPSPVSSVSAPAPPVISVFPGTVKISVRIPGRILAAFKTRAAERRQPYQKLLNQVLRDAVRGWEATAKA